MSTNLYCISIELPDELNATIDRVKEAFSARYSSKKALNHRARITLVPPFKADKDLAASLGRGLSKLMRTQATFSLEFNGYGAFAPKVIYIKVEKSKELRQIYFNLKRFLIRYFPFENYHFGTGFQPNIVVAYRDLTKANYDRAILEYSTRKFRASLGVEGLYLLCHSGEKWEVIQRFELSARDKARQGALFD